MNEGVSGRDGRGKRLDMGRCGRGEGEEEEEERERGREKKGRGEGSL